MRLKSIFLCVSFLLLHLVSKAEISIGISRPYSGERVVNGFKIHVYVTSTYELTSVIASIDTVKSSLKYNRSASYYEGTIPLESFAPLSTLKLVVTATDYLNNKQTDTRTIVYSPPPVLTVLEPLNETVADPFMQIKLKIQDPDSCVVTVYNSTSTGSNLLYSAKAKDSLDTIIDLSAYKNSFLNTLEIEVTNSRNQSVGKAVHTIYVISNTLLKKYYTSDIGIRDFNYGKIFAYDQGLFDNDFDDYSFPEIIDIKTRAETVIPVKLKLVNNDYRYPSYSSYLTPYGAVFQGAIYPRDSVYLYDWNKNNLYKLDESGGYPYALALKGKYAVWGAYQSSASPLYLRNLDVLKDTLITKTYGTFPGIDVTEKGFVAYDTKRTSIVTYFKRVRDTIANGTGGNISYYSPLTNGHAVVYAGVSKNHNYIYLYDGTSTITLSDFIGADRFSSGVSYQINSKYVAYQKLNSTGKLQIWLRDSIGNDKQVTFFGSDSKIELLNSAGDIIFLYAGRNVFIKKTGKIFSIPYYGHVYSQDSTFYISIGRTLFKINADEGTLPITLSSFLAKNASDKNLLEWTYEASANLDHVNVERSSTGTGFTLIGTVYAKDNIQRDFSFTDAKPLNADNFYRLQFIDKDGSSEYSPIRVVHNNDLITAVYPNPATNKISLQLHSMQTTAATIEIYALDGKKLYTTKLTAGAGLSTQSIDVSKLKQGAYFITVTNAAKQKQTFRFEKQ